MFSDLRYVDEHFALPSTPHAFTDWLGADPLHAGEANDTPTGLGRDESPHARRPLPWLHSGNA